MRTATSRFLVLGQTVQLQVSRSCDLLRTIETTIDSLNITAAGLDAVLKALHEAEMRLPSVDAVIDPDDQIAPLYDAAAESFAAYHAELCRKRKSAMSSPDLLPEDGVVEAYELTIAKAAEVHNAIVELAWHLREHDADRDTDVSGPYKDANALFSAMGL